MIEITHRSRMVVCLAAGLACTPGFGWAQVDTLKHDPFARPLILKAPPPAAAQPRDNTGVGREAAPEQVWKPELEAVVVAGPKSAVSIGGTIVRLGEEINGHRLVEVNEQTAVFVRNRKRVIVSLRSTQSPETGPVRKDERAAPARPETPPRAEALPKPDGRGTAERRDERKAEEK